jgi:thiamine pyrophosphokinase
MPAEGLHQTKSQTSSARQEVFLSTNLPPIHPVSPVRRSVIFANGKLGSTSSWRPVMEADDLVIAVNGGSRHCQDLGIQPHVLVGDLDSLDEDAIARYELVGTKVIRYPSRKDFTDLELALLYVQEHGITEVLLIAALGFRWDQTLANLLLPAASSFSDLRIKLIDGEQEIQLLRAGERRILDGLPGDTVSLIPLGGEARGITTQGLEYPLRDETLHFGSTRGISNVLLDKTAKVSLREGLLIVVMIHAG